MKDLFKNYDRWKLSNREDEEDAENERLRREEEKMERADEERDREKDEPRLDYDCNFPSEDDLSLIRLEDLDLIFRLLIQGYSSPKKNHHSKRLKN